MDKTALITGAAHRVGAQIARSLHETGYSIAIHYNNSRARAEELASSLNAVRDNSAITVRCDLTEPEFVDSLIDTMTRKWGRLDLLVNNASIYRRSDPEVTDGAAWDTIVATNLRAPYLLSTKAIPLLRENTGSIVNLTDIYALRPQPGYAVYCASKAGLIGLTKALALDLAPDIRVNGVSPGPILWAAQDGPGHREDVLRKTPLGRLGETTDIAAAVCYLAAAPYVTGQILEVDGGRSLTI